MPHTLTLVVLLMCVASVFTSSVPLRDLLSTSTFTTGYVQRYEGFNADNTTNSLIMEGRLYYDLTNNLTRQDMTGKFGAQTIFHSPPSASFGYGMSITSAGIAECSKLPLPSFGAFVPSDVHFRATVMREGVLSDEYSFAVHLPTQSTEGMFWLQHGTHIPVAQYMAYKGAPSDFDSYLTFHDYEPSLHNADYLRTPPICE